MSSKDISYLELWRPFCSAEGNHLCIFGRGYYEERFCEIILNLDQWLKRCHLKYFLSGVLAALVFSGAESLCNFGRGYYEEDSCEIILNLDQWFRCLLKTFLIWSPGGPLSSEAEHLCNFGRGYQEEQFCDIILNFNQWFRRCLLKTFLIWSPVVQRSRTICAILF